MVKRVKLPGRVESAEMGGIVTGAGEILDDLKGKTQEVINTETDAELVRLDETKQGNLTFDQTPTENSTNPVTSGGVYAADQLLSQAIEAILLLIPSAASALNKLVDLATMNSSISTATASFKGTYNLVSDLHLTVSATHAQIAAALDALSLGADNNDYAFVQVPNTDLAPTDIKKTERYKFNGTNWAYEYDLNNSGFTAAQWAAINSNITAVLVSKLSALPTNEALTALLAAKQDNLTFDDAPTSGSNNPVKSGGIYTRNNEIIAMITALDAAKQDVLTFDITPTENSTNPVTSNGVYQAIYLVQAALAAMDGRMLTAEHSIEVLTEDVGVLRTLYQALSKSDIIVGALPATGVANTVYRVPGTSTYADWMYYNGAWVKLAEYTTLDGYLYKGIATPSSSPASSAVKMFYFALTAGTYTNFGNLVVTEGISILKYDGANWTQDKISYMDGGVFDVTAYSGSEFTSLYALLSDANLNNLIPTAVQKGGMSIKFVESSGHKYVQFRCKPQSFSLNPEDWAIYDDETLVECTEYIKVEIDKNGKILWGIEPNGNFFFGAGCPQQIKDYVLAHKAEILAELSNKVDKINGKGLIDNGYASASSSLASTEFLSVVTDKHGVLMESHDVNGDKHFYTPVHIEDRMELSQKALRYLNSVLGVSSDASDIVDYYSKNLVKESNNLRRWSDFKLFFFSDVHASQTNVKRIIDLANDFGGSKVDCIINGGDIVESLMNEGLSWYNDLVDSSNIPVLSIAGNHDCWKNSGWNWATGLEVYNLVTAKVKETVPSIVQPANAAIDGLNYYYKDFGNIRIICLLSMYDNINNINHYFDNAQNTWLVNVLENARTTYHYWKIVNYMPVPYTLQEGDEVYMTLTNDAELNNKTQQDYVREELNGKIYAVPMSVIIVNHAPYKTTQARRIESKKLNSWYDYAKESVDKNISFDKLSVDETAVSTVADYITAGGSFICWLTGHTHVDSVLTHALHEGQMMININTANYNGHYDGVDATEISDPSYDSFDYIGIDLKSGMLKVVRMGWAEDSSMRVRRSWCYDYVNNVLLSEN